MIPRGIRNNNPGNIKDYGVPWNGLMPFEDMNFDQANEGVMCVFRAPWWGIRALAKLLFNYRRLHGLNTIEQIINRWAPESDDNPTGEYVDYVCGKMGLPRNHQPDFSDFEQIKSLVVSIIEFENGTCPYSWEITTGLIMAGIEPDRY